MTIFAAIFVSLNLFSVNSDVSAVKQLDNASASKTIVVNDISPSKHVNLGSGIELAYESEGKSKVEIWDDPVNEPEPILN